MLCFVHKISTAWIRTIHGRLTHRLATTQTLARPQRAPPVLLSQKTFFVHTSDGSGAKCIYLEDTVPRKFVGAIHHVSFTTSSPNYRCVSLRTLRVVGVQVASVGRPFRISYYEIDDTVGTGLRGIPRNMQIPVPVVYSLLDSDEDVVDCQSLESSPPDRNEFCKLRSEADSDAELPAIDCALGRFASTIPSQPNYMLDRNSEFLPPRTGSVDNGSLGSNRPAHLVQTNPALDVRPHQVGSFMQPLFNQTGLNLFRRLRLQVHPRAQLPYVCEELRECWVVAYRLHSARTNS